MNGIRNATVRDRQWRTIAVARLDEPARVVLHDHTRLPGRFFGRMTASIQAELTG